MTIRTADTVQIDEVEDAISDAIGDSMDMDWTYRDGAKAILSAFAREGWVVAFERGVQK